MAPSERCAAAALTLLRMRTRWLKRRGTSSNTNQAANAQTTTHKAKLSSSRNLPLVVRSWRTRRMRTLRRDEADATRSIVMGCLVTEPLNRAMWMAGRTTPQQIDAGTHMECVARRRGPRTVASACATPLACIAVPRPKPHATSSRQRELNPLHSSYLQTSMRT